VGNSKTKVNRPTPSVVFQIDEFTYEGHPVRTVVLDDQPWFVAYDVCRITGWNLMTAVWSVHGDDRYSIPARCLGTGQAHLRITGDDAVWFFSEYGLHDVVFRSGDPYRKNFRRWIIGELLPTIAARGLPSTNRTDLPARRHKVTVSKSDQRRQKVDPLWRKPHALYRLFTDRCDLLYVGISLSALQRMSSHRARQPWWHEVASIEIEYYPTRQAVLSAERQAIRTEHPRYNVALVS